MRGQRLLDAMDGIAILIDPDLRVLAYGEPNWTDFWRRNGGDPDRGDFRGTDITEAFSEGDVRATYRQVFHDVLKGRRRAMQIDYRCDAPDIHRQMRLSVTAVEGDNGERGLLYQSIVLLQEQRPPLDIFGGHSANSDAPFVKICAVCARLAWPEAQHARDQIWIEPQEYYRQGGLERVRLSHGFCPACYIKLNDEPD